MTQTLPAFVLHWNNPEGAIRTARSLREHVPFADVTIIENGSATAARAEIGRQADGNAFRLVTLDRNLGFTGGMNHAVFQSGLCGDSPFVLLASHGVEVTPGCIQKVLAALAADPRAGLLVPRIDRDSPLLFGAAADWGGSAAPFIETVWASGALMVVRGEAFRAVGGFDDRLFAYYEDVDLTRRLRKAGWKVGMVPSAVFHEDGSTLPGFGRTYLISRNSMISAKGEGQVAFVKRAAAVATSSARALLGSLAPWRSRERRDLSRVFARGQFFGFVDGLSGVTGPGRVVSVKADERR